MRAAWLLLVLLAPVVQGGVSAPAHDLIVTLAPGTQADAWRDAVPQATPLTVFNGFVVLDAPARLEATLRTMPGVERIDRAIPLETTTDHSLRLTRADPTPTGLGNLSFTGAGVTIAVVDSGVDATHPDLAGRVKTNTRLVETTFVEVPEDLTGHGTHVAGIAAASGVSGGHAGVAPGASLVGIDITDRFTTASALLAYDWLFVNRERLGIDITVNAWGRTGRAVFDPTDPVVRAIDRLVDAGVVVVFSASNHGPTNATLSFESQDPRVITVGATDDAGVVQSYSSRGPAFTADRNLVKPDVVAPGDAIVSLRGLQSQPNPDTDVGALHRRLSGTSQAVPHVAGIVALMLEAAPGLKPADVHNALRGAAIDIGEPGPDDASGFGLVDARDSIRLARGLAADRANILIAGGLETYADSARATTPPPRSILGFLQPESRIWQTPIPVKPGAQRLTFELSWPTSSAALTATLDHDDVTMGTWTRTDSTDGRTTITGDVPNPAAGIWTLSARGATPVALELASVATIELPADPTRALPLDARYQLPPDAFGAHTPILHRLQVWGIEARLLNQAHPWAAPTLSGALLGALIGLSRYARPRDPLLIPVRHP